MSDFCVLDEHSGVGFIHHIKYYYSKVITLDDRARYYYLTDISCSFKISLYKLSCFKCPSGELFYHKNSFYDNFSFTFNDDWIKVIFFKFDRIESCYKFIINKKGLFVFDWAYFHTYNQEDLRIIDRSFIFGEEFIKKPVKRLA